MIQFTLQSRVLLDTRLNYTVGRLQLASVNVLFIPRMHYSSHGAYSQSKLALVLFTYYLQEQLMASGSSVTVNAVDPGMVDTALYDNLWSLAQAMKKPVAKILFRVRLHWFSYSSPSHRVLCDRSGYPAAASVY